jgi:hypothetical protein
MGGKYLGGESISKIDTKTDYRKAMDNLEGYESTVNQYRAN